jgi:hypothetical protein
MINPAQKLASTKAGEHSARRPPEKKRNLLQKAGDWLVGDADLTSPRDWAKGLGQAANENLIQPVYRTASGQNFRTLVAPSSTLNQRINAVGEDALNIVSLVPGVGAAAKGLASARAAKTLNRAAASTPELFEYGVHVSNRLTPTATNVGKDVLKNRGGAGDALPGYAYQWRMSPGYGNRLSFDELKKQATQDATDWAERLDTWQINDPFEVSASLTRGPAEGVIDDANIENVLNPWGQNRGAAVPNDLEILNQVRPERVSSPEQLESLRKAIEEMLEARRYEIMGNNRRLYYSNEADWANLLSSVRGKK